ncbi:MAG: hypothetical protein US96_C0015G0006 [Candidatus Woesebacteria bacterium GW2011_GWB1_38_5b]|uniref:RNA-binding protein KhpA n=1 Tax=Candidatus Woesebacteria bacterium GW2011_GWB1_38_5b TaxID=1618569 RepID=A0A0G0KI69_9BACT|nr:MAG: hypothetical protein US96_C0015G0006 [Candidatus Woesebacteria bacterium GW2011_GWB1_38_5b]OGH47500.1 MAG: hypothetical protein A3A51_02835 [Candidatus Levybacteria bacterium RIFCSPLOWO2_01_FULL_39_10]
MRDILKYLITSIVDKPEAVEILEEENQGIVNLTVKVDPQDMGKVIGKEGKVIRALRNVLRIPAVLQDKKIYINLSEN